MNAVPPDPEETKLPQEEWKRSLPFPRRWFAYLALKIVVLGAAIYVALRIYGLV